jgi:hypothetical protein
MAQKLVTAAWQFKEHWESGCATPSLSTANQAEKMPKAPDPSLLALLRSVETGDETAIPTLADWLERRGDPRAPAIREVAGLEAVVRETSIDFVLNGKRYGPTAFMMRTTGDTEESIAQRVREVRWRQQSDEVWLRLGLTRALSETLKQYLGINNSMGVAAAIEEIAQRWGKQVQTIRSRIELALYLLTLQVRLVPGRPGGAWRAVGQGEAEAEPAKKKGKRK